MQTTMDISREQFLLTASKFDIQEMGREKGLIMGYYLLRYKINTNNTERTGIIPY